MTLKIISFTFIISLYFTNAFNLSKISNNPSINGHSPTSLPTPSPLALECFETILSEANECRENTIKNWNINNKSHIKDLCCAEWDLLECDFNAALVKCHPEELEEMDLYLESLVEYYESASCERYPKESSNCKIELPIVSKSQHDRPPLPPPLAIDCLGNIKKEVREGCYLNAVTKWNITRRSPIKNVCCATWDNIDCLDQIAKVRCPSAEVSDTEDYFKQIEDWAAKEACSEVPYHSANCSNSPVSESKPQLRPYISNTESKLELAPYIPISIANKNSNRVNEDYVHYMLNLLMSAFPQLLHLMIFLAIILVVIIALLQYHILMRQNRQKRFLACIRRKSQVHHKLLSP